MKIVCDNCATKYSIADEKVRGKVFKIRCKKCSHIIVVRGGADGNAEASRDSAAQTGEGFPAVDDQQTVSARGGAAAVAATGDAVWHLVIDREQVGPMTPAEVRSKFAEGAIDAETYAWREGFGDWLRLGSIEDFRDLGGAGAPDDGATRRSDAADLFAGAGGGEEGPPATEGGADLFGGGAPAPAYSSAPAPSSSEDVFGGGGALFGAPSAAASPARAQRTSSPGFAAQAAAEPAAAASPNIGEVRPMTGQRNENSVLFSLNNLQALATGGGGAKAASSSSSSSSSEARPGFASSQTEGSGLIDIRAMAASTLAASPGSSGSGGKGEDLPGLGSAPVFSPMAAPILMPAAPSGPPKWMWAILGIGVAAVLGIVVVGILLLMKKTPETVATVAPAATGPAAATPAAPSAAPAAAAPAAAAPAAAPGAVAANEARDEGKKHHKTAAPGGVKVAKNESPKAESAPPVAAAPAPAAPAPKKSGKRDELDDLLNGASPGDSPKPRKKAASDDGDSAGGAAASGGGENLPDQLDKGQIVGGMTRVKPRVAACYDQYKVPGMANVSVTINNSGRVGNATVGGAFAGTPTGDCVTRAVKSASFPRFKGSAQTINYPFILR